MLAVYHFVYTVFCEWKCLPVNYRRRMNPVSVSDATASTSLTQRKFGNLRHLMPAIRSSTRYPVWRRRHRPQEHEWQMSAPSTLHEDANRRRCHRGRQRRQPAHRATMTSFLRHSHEPWQRSDAFFPTPLCFVCFCLLSFSVFSLPHSQP